MLTIDQEIFAENLLLTQIYCEEQLKNTDKSDAEILRSINPMRDGERVFSFKTADFSYFKWTLAPLEFGVYEDLFEEQLQTKKSISPLDNRTFKGEILVVELDNTLKDGASESCTKGFIDLNDCPPIDTWFYLTEGNVGRILYAWIPQQFVSVVQDGIDVNVTGLFRWETDWTDIEAHESFKNSNHDFSLKNSYEENLSLWRKSILFFIALCVFQLLRYLFGK